MCDLCTDDAVALQNSDGGKNEILKGCGSIMWIMGKVDVSRWSRSIFLSLRCFFFFNFARLNLDLERWLGWGVASNDSSLAGSHSPASSVFSIIVVNAYPLPPHTPYKPVQILHTLHTPSVLQGAAPANRCELVACCSTSRLP